MLPDLATVGFATKDLAAPGLGTKDPAAEDVPAKDPTAPDLAAEDVAAAMARRIAALRKGFGLSFEALAQKAGVAKGTLVLIEQSRANPSISTLCRLAAALEVSVADLVAPQTDTPVTVVPDGRRLWAGPKGGHATLLAGTPGPDMLEIWDWCLMPGERFLAAIHGRGTRELLHVRAGLLTLTVDGTASLIAHGASAIARTDRPHAYANHGPALCLFTMTVHEPPAGA